jgi:hypothetical protein
MPSHVKCRNNTDFLCRHNEEYRVRKSAKDRSTRQVVNFGKAQRAFFYGLQAPGGLFQECVT